MSFTKDLGQQADVRFEWGPVGAAELASTCEVLVVVDIFSFTTAVDVAVGRGAIVYPFPRQDSSAAEFARTIGAELAVDRRKISAERPYSLWPRSLERILEGTKLVLPSPNGSAISAAAADSGCHVLAGCFRNRSAVARTALELGATVGVIAAGERWPDGSLRPAYEDVIGAGAIIRCLAREGRRLSAEAAATAAAFDDAQSHLSERLRGTASSSELIALGFGDDADIAGHVDVSASRPHLLDGAYRNVTEQA
jgi:2-phosphosulfolactate phosphatase